MRVLHVIPGISPEFGGPSTAIWQMCGALKKRGIDVEIATTNTHVGHLHREAIGSAVMVNDIKVWWFHCNTFSRYGVSVGMTTWLRRRAADYDLVHIHAFFSYIPPITAHYCKKHRVPYVVRPIGQLDPWSLSRGSWLKTPFYRLLGRDLLRAAAAVHVTSPMEWENLRDLGFGEKSFVVPLGVEIPENSRRRQVLPSTGRCRILFLSRLDPKKGIEVLLESVKQARNVGLPVQLTIGGAGERAYAARVQGIVRSKQLEAEVDFLGFADERVKTRCFQEASVFVLPSYQENFGLAAVEAMAAGVPVIVSDRVALADEIARADAGQVISPGSSAELLDAIRNVVNNPEQWAARGERARQLVKDRFSWALASRSLVDLYNYILTRVVRGRDT